jgi:hypothetical protein
LTKSAARGWREEETNSFFSVLNLISPKARDTEMSPHIRPSKIYRKG